MRRFSQSMEFPCNTPSNIIPLSEKQRLAWPSLSNPAARSLQASDCIAGEAFDVVVDLRKGSPTYGRHECFELTGAGGDSVFVPAGCAHGFYVPVRKRNFALQRQHGRLTARFSKSEISARHSCRASAPLAARGTTPSSRDGLHQRQLARRRALALPTSSASHADSCGPSLPSP